MERRVTDGLSYAELLTARFCHDITGPVGAVGNGMEFLAEEGFSMQGDAFSLVEKSAKESVARLRFFRHAYGSMSGEGQADLAEISEVAQSLFSYSKVELIWNDAYKHELPFLFSQQHGKVILNALVIALDILIYGGKTKVLLEGGRGAGVVKVVMDGRGVKVDEGLKNMLSGNVIKAALNTHNIQHYFTFLLAERCGVDINIEHTETQCILTMTLS